MTLSIARVIDNIYVGDLVSANNTKLLHEFGINVVINMSDRPPSIKDPNIRYYRFPIEDGPVYPGERSKTFAIIRLALRTARNALDRGDKVLIHCISGVNRSPLTIGLLLVSQKEMTPEEALGLLVEANQIRNVVLLTNEDFCQELAQAVVGQPPR